MKKLERFILRDIIADSAAGTVYKAEEVLPGDNRRIVALKVLPPISDGDKLGEERFFNEVRVLAQLSVQPHVVTIYAMGQTEGYPWLAMEYAEATAQTKMAEDSANATEVLKLLEQVGNGLAAIHALKPPLVHQDIKPGNVLIDAGSNYKITDFSLATVVAANRTHGLATVRYAAPELLSSEFGRVGPQTDLYALGHVAYEMALGGRLHRAQFPAVFEGNTTREPPPNKWMMWHASMNTRPVSIVEVVKDFPAGLSDIVAKLIAKQMNLRYQSAEELQTDLGRARNAILHGGTAERSVTTMPLPALPSIPPVATAASTAPRATAPVPVPPPPQPSAEDAAGAASSAPARAGMAGANLKYWVRLRGRVTGPYDLASLQRQVRQGQLSRLHQVSSDQVNWKSSSDVEGLYGPTVV